MARIRSSGKFLNLTSRYYNDLAAVVYADIFGYPLTVKEAKLWSIRKVREKCSEEIFDQAVKISSWLKIIPSIQAVYLTGSAAVKNAQRGADVDLMIITSSNTVWLTRGVVFLILKLINKLKKPYCPNIFLDENHLEIRRRNLFTAHELAQVKCVYEKNNISHKLFEVNKWVKEYLPLPFELLTFLIQYYYQKNRQTNETVGWGVAFFHPDELSQKVLQKFEKRLLKYTGK